MATAHGNNGIVVQDGQLVMLCGSTAVPIRYRGKDGEEIAANDYQTMFAREHNQESSDANSRTNQSN